MGRIQNYKNWSPDLVPDQTKSSLGLEYFLWEQDQEWEWPDERLIEVGCRECAQLGLIELNEIEDGTVVRMKKAYPVYDQQYHANLNTIRQYLENFPNLYPIGRNGQHRYNNQDHSMLTGVYAARNIFGEHHDIWDVNTEWEYHEVHHGSPAVSGERLIPSRIQPNEQAVSEPVEESSDETIVEQIIEQGFAHLDPIALGIAVACVCGAGLFLATVILLFKGGSVIGPRLALLSHYLPGYTVTWPGAFIGLLEAALIGFLIGYSVARLRNWGLSMYVARLQKRAEAKERRDALGKII
jgi:hypothetical protein